MVMKTREQAEVDRFLAKGGCVSYTREGTTYHVSVRHYSKLRSQPCHGTGVKDTLHAATVSAVVRHTFSSMYILDLSPDDVTMSSFIIRRNFIPEAPELRISCDMLRSLLVGRDITSFYMIEDGGGRYTEESPPTGFKELPQGHVLVSSIDVHGKFMWWTLLDRSTGMHFYMHCTYGMSGQWRTIWVDDDGGADMPKNVSFSIRYHDPSSFPSKASFIHFVDQRHFGTIKFVYDVAEHEKKLKTFGLDPFKSIKYCDMVARVKKHGKKTMAELLMSQTAVFAGVGNYLKAEILYACRLSPHRLAETLTDDQLMALFKNTVIIMEQSYRSKGASFKTYKNVDGENGNYAFEMKVYRRTCSANGYKVISEETKDKRTTWWCPQIQN